MKLHKTIVTNKGEVLTNPEDIIAYNLSSLLFCCINILYIIKNNTYFQSKTFSSLSIEPSQCCIFDDIFANIFDAFREACFCLLERCLFLKYL